MECFLLRADESEQQRRTVNCDWVIVTPERSKIKASINPLLFLLLLLQSLGLRSKHRYSHKSSTCFPVTTINTSSDQRQVASRIPNITQADLPRPSGSTSWRFHRNMLIRFCYSAQTSLPARGNRQSFNDYYLATMSRVRSDNANLKLDARRGGTTIANNKRSRPVSNATARPFITTGE